MSEERLESVNEAWQCEAWGDDYYKTFLALIYAKNYVTCTKTFRIDATIFVNYVKI